MVEIECLACGEILKMPQYVTDNTDDFDGEVVCQKCKSRLHLRLVKEKVLKYKVVKVVKEQMTGDVPVIIQPVVYERKEDAT